MKPHPLRQLLRHPLVVPAHGLRYLAQPYSVVERIASHVCVKVSSRAVMHRRWTPAKASVRIVIPWVRQAMTVDQKSSAQSRTPGGGRISERTGRAEAKQPGTTTSFRFPSSPSGTRMPASSGFCLTRCRRAAGQIARSRSVISRYDGTTRPTRTGRGPFMPRARKPDDHAVPPSRQPGSTLGAAHGMTGRLVP